MATNNTPAVKNLGLGELKDAGVKSAQIALAAGITVFAVQAAVTAGKALVANSKSLANGLKG